MHRFQDILYVTLGRDESSPALKRALRTARENDAPLGILACLPEFPVDLADYREPFERSMRERLQTAVARDCEELDLDLDADSVDCDIEFGKTPGLRIVRRVLRRGCQLVIKDTEPHEGGRGFQALDMELLRKCPCALWLCRPERTRREHPRVAVAVNPESASPTGEALALRLLELSSSLASRLGGELDVVSCWDYGFEEPLRNSAWYQVPEEELEQAVARTRHRHRELLEKLLERSVVRHSVVRHSRTEECLRVHHLHGQPDEAIPRFVEENDIDILVMGTVARTGIPGFLIGNTAENVFQKIPCSLLALKPEGFACPVRPDP